ncbi:uncharacterized protein LOC129809671 [Phlebotomus papatasi]|uniref:uncharacterized protein LOC129809671 n=1 Tax=Phlebotomus papatasi TaxID=29031 RepID=UPI002484091E|nr:uncharacterized protein LOC129809671 [Phlebotomus papatasi]
MKISVVLLVTLLGCALAQEELSSRRDKRTAHFLLHQFADLLGYDIIPKAAVVTDIRSRLGLPPLQQLGQPQTQPQTPQTPQTQTPQTQPPKTQPPQTQAPPKTSTMGTSTTTRGSSTASQAPAKTPTTSAQAPPSSEGPVRLPLPLNILNRLQPTVPILNPINPTPAVRLEQPAPPAPPQQPEFGIQHTNFSLNYLFTRVPPTAPPSASSSASDSNSNSASDEAPTGPSAEAPSAEDGSPENPPRFVDDNYVFNPRDASDEEYNPNLAFSGWRPPNPEDFNFEESSEVKFNPAPTTRSAPQPPQFSKLDPVAVAYPHSNYISAFVPGSLHRRRSATSQHSVHVKTPGSFYGYVTYHEPPYETRRFH